MAQSKEEVRAVHWGKTRNLTFVILALWFFFAYVVHWFAKSLNTVTFLDFPLGYYMAAQGSLAVFVILIFAQNYLQDKIDDEAGFTEN